MQELSRASEGVRGHARKCEDVQPSVRAYECVQECARVVEHKEHMSPSESVQGHGKMCKRVQWCVMAFQGV